MLKEGMFIQERYEIISKIGSGGMADVYKAKDHKLNRLVAVKVLKAEFRADKAFIAKFRAEAQSAAGLAHPNIVNVYDVGEDHGVSYMVMELVAGITLKDYIEKKGRLAVREATSIAIQVSMGLEAAHNNNIVHRDVKPQNIIISTDGKVKVTDFGIARAASSNTISSNVMGSVHYSSPEQARGGYSDFKSDIYSLGITMYEMLTGHVPFDGESTVAIAIKHLQEEMQSPRKYVPDLPKSTVQIIYKCTQKSPDRRYACMSELIRDLKESLVNPEGDFVAIVPLNNHAQTVVISEEEMGQIKRGYGEGVAAGAGASAADSYAGESYGDPGYGNYAAGGYNDNYNNQNYNNQNAGYRGGYRGDYYENKEDDEEYDDSSKLEKFMTIGSVIIGIVILVIVLAIVGNALNIFKFDFMGDNKPSTEMSTDGLMTEEESEVAVPNLLGKTEAEAEAILADRSLGAQFGGEETSDKYPAGQIISQTPEADAIVKPNTTVTYIVSRGEGDVVVPDVTNHTASEAQTMLTEKGLKFSTDYTYSDEVSEGLVARTEPSADASVKPGTTITIYISRGPESEEDSEEEEVEVPDVVGDDVETAKSKITGAGLTPNVVEDVSTDVPAGQIIGQDIGYGTMVKKGTTITITVSVGAGDPEETEPKETEEIIDMPSDGPDEPSGQTYSCDVSLGAPSNYNGEPVRIEMIKDGTTTTILDGSAVSFPYNFAQTSTTGSDATVNFYVYDPDTGDVINKVTYNVPFTAD